MVIRKLTIDKLMEMSGKRNIIAYAAGMVAYHIQDIIKKYKIADDILFFVDSDNQKIGKNIAIGGKKYEIYDISKLYDSRYENCSIMITCENAYDVFQSLNNDCNIVVEDVFFYEDLNDELIESAIRLDAYKIDDKNNARIPRKIHYCWFGKGEMPIEQKLYIEDWKKKLYMYDFYLWNEDNYDINQCTYIKEAYESGFYAYVSDYVRMDVVYKYGGFYFDTDVEMIGDIEALRKYDAFFTYGKWPSVASGAGFGAVVGNEIIKEMRDNPRSYINFVDENGSYNKKTNIYYETPVMKNIGFVMDFSTQIINNICLLSPKYFPPSNYLKKHEIPREAIALHKDAGSWKVKN